MDEERRVIELLPYDELIEQALELMEKSPPSEKKEAASGMLARDLTNLFILRHPPE